MDFETLIKVIVVGNGGVGKSSMAARYCNGVFTSSYKKTIGVDYLEKTIETEGGESVKMMVWDTAGQEEFDAITASYYRGAGACALVFSTTDRASFDAIEKWKRKVEESCGKIVMALVQNKIDLMDKATMTEAEVSALATKLKMPLFKTCVKDDVNVGEVFEYLAGQYILRGGDTTGLSSIAAIGDYSMTDATSTRKMNLPSEEETAPVAENVAADEDTEDKAAQQRAAAAQQTAAAPAASTPATSTQAASGAGVGTRGNAALPPPPTSGAFKLTAEPKIKKKSFFC